MAALAAVFSAPRVGYKARVLMGFFSVFAAGIAVSKVFPLTASSVNVVGFGTRV